MKTDTLIFWGAVALIVFGGGTLVYNATRGLRLNNPGNLENDGTQWQGLTPTQSDPTFFEFQLPEYGIRALRIDLTNAIARGYNTISSLITHYAPPSENDTAAYIAAVSDRTGIDAGAPIDTSSVPALVGAVIIQEQGLNPYSDAIMQKGLTMA